MEQKHNLPQETYFYFICSHGRKMPSVKDSDFGTGRVGKLHAVAQKVKCTKTKGTVMKGKYNYQEFIDYLNSVILWVLIFYEFNWLFILNINLFFDVIDVDSMATKEAKKRVKIYV